MARTYRKTYKCGQKWCNKYDCTRNYFGSYLDVVAEKHIKQFNAFRKLDGKGFWTESSGPAWYRRYENKKLRAKQRKELFNLLINEDIIISNKKNNSSWWW